jgi:hypothetical protein
MNVTFVARFYRDSNAKINVNTFFGLNCHRYSSACYRNISYIKKSCYRNHCGIKKVKHHITTDIIKVEARASVMTCDGAERLLRSL